MKNKILISILAVFALVLSVSLASAAVTVSSSFSDSTPTFGSSSQAASNPNSDTTSEKNVYDDGEVTINSTANAVVSSITVTAASGFSNTDSGSSGYINITLNDADLTLAAGVAEAITLRARIPESLDAVDGDGDAKAVKIATILFTLNDASTVSFDAYAQRENQLELSSLEVTSQEHTGDDVDDGDTIDELKPGDDVDLEIQAENKYTSSDDVDMENVEAYVLVDEDDMDVDESEDMNDIDASDDDTVTVKFTVDSDTDEGTYSGYVYVIAEDEHGANHGQKYDVDFKVERESHELLFTTASVSPTEVSCSRKLTINSKIENTGSNDEDEASIYIKNSVLGINLYKKNIDIESTDTYTYNSEATIADTVGAGTYLLKFYTYYSGDESDGVQSDAKDVEVVVSKCVPTAATTTTTTTTPVSGVIIVDETSTAATTTGSSTTTRTTAAEEESSVLDTTEEDQSFTDSTAYTVLLVTGIIAVIIVGVGLVFKFLILG